MILVISSKIRKIAGLIVVALVVTGCTITAPGTINDPSERENRKVHRFNKAVDKNLLSPVSKAYGKIIPPSADSKVGNFVDNLAIPGEIINSVLQLNFEDVTINTIRFAVNTIFGLGGIFDFASEIGMEADVDTDFGETLYVLGFPEGEYIELPLLGPSTERDTYGKVVDFFLNPLDRIAPRSIRRVKTPAYVLDKVGDRHQYAEFIDGILYNSEDSYSTARSIYLQRRRFQLNRGINLDELEDPYAN